MRILALFFLCFAAHAGEGEAPGWKALLHYEGSQSSASPGQAFFLSPQGHVDPEAEFQATLALFQQFPEEAACRFPARALYLQRLGRVVAEPKCERFLKWRAAIDPRGLELVFAAAFINSPSSMYGHTLLKFPRGGKTEGHELLDYTLNFGAETGGAGGFAYLWLGLTGGFPGYFSTAPFYLKVKEYNFVENRDFWVYPLNLSDAELELLLRHAWEVREVKFPYFFLRKNCSYFLLEFLEVARPGQGLTAHFPYWAVPMDTIRLLQKHNWLGEGTLRPSRYRLLNARAGLLSKAGKQELNSLLREGSLPAGEESAPVLDTAYELLRFRTEGKNIAASDAELERKILTERRKYPPAKALAFSELAPEKGHPTNRFYLGVGRNKDHAFGEISYRGTLHDLLSDSLGYEDFSELSMGDIRVRWEAGKIFPERVDVLRLRSLAPWDAWIPKRSWSFKGGFARAKELGCAAWRCLYGSLQGGMGASARLGSVLGFALAELDFQLGGVFNKDLRFLGGGTAGVWTPLWPGARVLLEGEFRWRLLGEKRTPRTYRAGFSQTLGRQWELRLSGERNRSYREALLAGHFYF